MNAPATGIVNIKGKEYHTVAKRVSDFRTEHGDKYGLCTEIVQSDDVIVMRALIIGREDNFVVATGTAEERRGAGQINKTSALENAETSAIGRALAAFGIGGTEFASANEVQNAVHQQQEGHSQNGAVSPPAKGWREPDNEFYRTPTALHKGLTHHSEELRRIGEEATFDDLEAHLTSPEYAEFMQTANKHAKHYLEGGPPLPEEFSSIFSLEQRARDLIALRGNNSVEKEPAE